MANIHEHAVLSDILKPNGSGYIASHGEDFLLANNAQWIGFSVEVGPDGGLYILDWHDADICGNEVVNKETGRVFRIMPERSRAFDWPNRYGDLRTFSDEALVNLQLSKSDWHARRARIILQNRASKNLLSDNTASVIRQLIKQTKDPDLLLKLMWTQWVCGLLDEPQLLQYSKSQDRHLRAWGHSILN